jgi:SHS2 domain-containing protein
MKYKIIDDLTSDIMFEAYGKTLEKVFENAALALSSIICKIEKVKQKKEITIEVKAENTKELMFSFLQEIIAQVDIEEMFFSKFKITNITKTKVNAILYGEEITPEKGEVVVKALTNHKFEFKKTKEGYKVNVVLDI